MEQPRSPLQRGEPQKGEPSSLEIKIMAEPSTSGDSCKFTVDRTIYAGSAYFGNKTVAKDSPLAQKIFEIENITSVMISGNVVTVTKSGMEDWVPFGKKIGPMIRSVLQSGVPAVTITVLANAVPDSEVKEKIQRLLDTEINPAIAMHGGHVTLLDAKDNNVYIQLGGGCQGCGMADVTLKQGIEVRIREILPQIMSIVDQTDHAGGTNPYYQPSTK